MAASRRTMPTGCTTASIPSCTKERRAISAPRKLRRDRNLRHSLRGLETIDDPTEIPPGYDLVDLPLTGRRPLAGLTVETNRLGGCMGQARPFEQVGGVAELVDGTGESEGGDLGIVNLRPDRFGEVGGVYYREVAF